MVGAIAQWDRSDYFSALILDAINQSNYLIQATNWNGKGDAPKPPEPMPRPKDPEAEQPVEEIRFQSAAEIRAWKEDVSKPTVILYE